MPVAGMPRNATNGLSLLRPITNPMALANAHSTIAPMRPSVSRKLFKVADDADIEAGLFWQL